MRNIRFNQNVIDSPDKFKKELTFDNKSYIKSISGISLISSSRQKKIMKENFINLIKKDSPNNNLKNNLKQKMKVKFNFCEMIIKLFCFCFLNNKLQSKRVLLEKGVEKLNYNMNILTYIKKNSDVTDTTLFMYS